jgi:hypothetical protein
VGECRKPDAFQTEIFCSVEQESRDLCDRFSFAGQIGLRDQTSWEESCGFRVSIAKLSKLYLRPDKYKGERGGSRRTYGKVIAVAAPTVSGE